LGGNFYDEPGEAGIYRHLGPLQGYPSELNYLPQIQWLVIIEGPGKQEICALEILENQKGTE
jgi:hypothetical protein